MKIIKMFFAIGIGSILCACTFSEEKKYEQARLELERLGLACCAEIEGCRADITNGYYKDRTQVTSMEPLRGTGYYTVEPDVFSHKRCPYTAVKMEINPPNNCVLKEAWPYK